MTTQQTAGHDDTRPAYEWQGLQLFALEGEEGGAGDEGDGSAAGAAGADAAADAGAGNPDNNQPDAGAGEAGQGAADGGKSDGGEGDKDPAAGPPEKYDLTIPEGYAVDDNLVGEFTTTAKELGLNNDQANKLVGMHTQIMTDAFQALNEARNQEVVGWGESAKQELGKDYDGTLNYVAVGVAEAEKQIPTLREAMDKTGFGNTVEGIKLMASIGRLLGEDQGGKDAGGRSAGNGPLYSDMTNFKK